MKSAATKETETPKKGSNDEKTRQVKEEEKITNKTQSKSDKNVPATTLEKRASLPTSKIAEEKNLPTKGESSTKKGNKDEEAPSSTELDTQPTVAATDKETKKLKDEPAATVVKESSDPKKTGWYAYVRFLKCVFLVQD